MIEIISLSSAFPLGKDTLRTQDANAIGMGKALQTKKNRPVGIVISKKSARNRKWVLFATKSCS
ncbi:MAG: hypothetical protein GX421_05490 [Caldisericales bacterium]|nr:hypothetical protein [Caldisericales bacterium]